MTHLAAVRALTRILFLAAIAGCAAQTEIVKLYENTTAAAVPYDNILVVGMTPSVDERRKFEDLLVRDLASAGSSAIASYSIVGLTPTILQQDIDAAADRTNADAIMLTHIVSVDREIEFQKGRTEVLFECRGGDPADYFLYDQKVLTLPDSVRIAHTVVAVTSLYDTASNSRVWTIQSTCFEKENMDVVLREESRAIVRQLELDKLID